MNDPFAGMPDVVESGASPVNAFAGIPDDVGDPFKDLPDVVTPDNPAVRFGSMLSDPDWRDRLTKQAARMGTTIGNPEFQARMQTPMGFRARTTLMQLADTGNPDEVNALDANGKPTGLGLRAALTQFGHAGGARRRRNDATISRIAAGQEIEVGDTREIGEQIAKGMAGMPRPNMRVFKKIEDMTRAEQDATVPQEVLDIVNQSEKPGVQLDPKTRAQMIYDAAKAGAMSREQTRQAAKEEIAIREELTGKSDGLVNTVGNLAAQGMPTVGYGNSFLVGGVGLAAAVSGADKTSELLSADIDPETGKPKTEGADYDTARLRGYGYGAFEALSEKYTGKVLRLAFRGLDRVTGGYVGSILSKGLDKAADAFAKTTLGRGVAELAKGVQRIAGLSAVDNPATEILAEEAEQQWADKAFAQRSGDTEATVYAKNVFNEATGQIEQVLVEPGSTEEETARRQIARYGAKSEYVEAGKRQMTLGEKTDAFAADFYTWENMADLAESFALQYVLQLGGGALHAVQTKETRGRIEKGLLLAGANNADLVRMSDEQKAAAFEMYYGNKENQAEFAAVFKDAGDKLSDMAQRMQDARLWQETGNSLKPNFTADLAKAFESGTPTVQDEAAKIAVTQNVAVQGTTYTLHDLDGMLNDVTVGSVAEAQQAAEKMSQLKQGRQANMNNRAEIAQRLAEIFAPGRKLVLVQSDADMLGATRAEYEAEGAEFDEAGFKAGAKGATTPGGTLIVNVAAATGVPDLVNTLTHETGHSVFTQAGLTRLMQGKGIEELAVEFQKAKVIPAGPAAKADFIKAVVEMRAAYAARGVTLDDAGAVEEVLANLNEGLSPVMRKRFGDGLVGLFKKIRGTDGTATSINDARRIAAGILHGSKSPDVRLYGGKDAWKMPAPAFTGDPVAQQQAAPAANAPAAPAGTAAPQGVAVTPPKPAEPTAGASEPVVPAVQQATEATPPAESTPEPKAVEPEAEQPPAAPKEKKVFASDEEFADYFDKHRDEVAGWEEGVDFEIKTPAAPKAETKPTEQEPKAEEPVLDGGTPADIEADKAKLEAQRKKQAERKEIEDKAKAPIEGGMGDMTAALPGMEHTDDIPLFNPVAQPSKAETKADAAPFEIEGVKFGGTQKLPGMPDQHLWEDSQTGGKIIVPATATKAEVQARIDAGRVKTAAKKPQPEAEKPKQSNVAKANAEVDFGGTVKQGQYAEIVGITDGRGKRVYLNQNKWGYSGHRVSSYHHGLVLNGHAVLLRTKGKSSQIDGVRIIGGAAAPEGSKDWTVADWEKYNRELSSTKAEPPNAKEGKPEETKAPEVKPVEPKPVEQPPKAVESKPKMRFPSEDAMAAWAADHYAELENAPEDWYEIEAAPEVETMPEAEPVQTEEEVFAPRKKKLAEPEVVYRREIEKDRKAWEAQQAAKKAQATTEDKAPFEVEGLKFNGVQRVPGMPDHNVWTDEQNGGTFYMPADATKADTEKHRDEARARFEQNETPGVEQPSNKPSVPTQASKHSGFVLVASGVTPSDFEAVHRRYVDRRNTAKGGAEGTTIRRQKVISGDDAWLKYQNTEAGAIIYDNLNLYVPAEHVETWREVALAAGRRDLIAGESANPKDAEEAEEARQNAETQARVKAIPEQEYSAAPALAAMDAELPAYDKRKAATTRTADSKERQAYSTPPPLAAIGAEAARGAVTVIEPTAGNGGLLAPLRLDIAPKPSAKALTTRGGVLPKQGAKMKVLANELDPARAERLTALLTGMGQTDGVTMGDYAAQEFQDAVAEATKDGKRAFLMNPPFGPADASGFKLEHRIALKTIESAVPGDTLFGIFAAPGRDAMTVPAGLLAGRYTTGEFAKFHSELNRRGWQATLHFIADGSLYRKMGAAFPVEVLLMEKTDGSKPNLHMPMRNLPARYSTWEDIQAAVAEMYDPGAATLAERLELNLGDTARQEADMQAQASAPVVREARQKEPGGVRYRLSQDIELGLVTPQTDASVPPHVLKIIGRVWVKEFGGKARNPDELAAAILALPAETAEARIKVADAIAAHLRGDPAAGFNVGADYVSMGPALREAFQARWNQARDAEREDDSEKGQVPYTTLSGVPVVSPMMLPRDIGLATATALDAFYERHPEGVDAFVAAKLGWTLAQATDGRLDGSQMDTLALALDKVDDGSGFIVGSMTGAGKGRVMAALMAYHIKQGRVPVFLTAKANLFTAMWEDITAIGEADLFKPLVFNDYKAPKADGDEEDENGFLMPQFFTPMQRNAAIADGKMPKGATVVFLTYSQVQNPTQSTQRKITFVENVLRAGGGLVMDEAHLAAGSDSNTGAVLRHLADLPKSGVVFSSATFAKRGENMTLYKRAGYSKFFQNDDEMEEALAFGKVPFQQYLAARLTEGGFYLRHELDYTGIEFEKITTTDTLDTPAERTTLANREEQIADVYNQVVRTVMRFGVLVKGVNNRLQKGSPGAHMDGEAFMSSLHNTASFIYTALKAETVANAAVKALRAGRSPVITLYNTNQALLEEIGTGNQADVGRYLMRIAEKAVAITMPDGSSASILTPAGYGQLVSLVKESDAAMLANAADALMRQARSASDYLREQNLPASPIDRVREIIEAAGFKFAELTGRSLMVKNGVIETRVKPRPDDVVHDFNNSVTTDGKPDTVLLLNSSGATGLSIHNSPKFKNRATREMFILQPAWDINEMMQTFGRVNRKDQLTNPIYHLMFTSAAGEQRNAAILMQKLRSLSANTSGVSKAGYGESADDALDFMNAMGDKALAELTKEKNPAVSSINALRHSETIRRATAISQFLPVAEQAEFIRQIQDKVAAMHENARESGMHDLEAGDIGRLPLTAEQLATGTIMRAYEVPVVGKAKILTAAEAQEQARQWQDKHPDLLDTAKAKIAKAVEATQNPWLHRVYADAAQLLEHAVDSVGRVWSVKSPIDSRRAFFIPMGLHLPPGGSAQTASDWRVKVAFNNIRGVTTVPLSIFSNTLLSQAVEERSYSYNNNLSRKEDRTVVTGDIAKALIGNIIAAGQNAVGSPQIVRALPLDGNFASFVLLMPRGVSVAAAKRVVSAKRVPLTDVLDIQSTQRGWVEIDAGRVRIAKTINRMGDQNGAVFSYRMATPRGARSGAVGIAQIMRATGAENRVNDTPNAQGYVDGPYLSVEQANRALAALAKLHPALAATQIISDSETVGGQAAAPEKTPRASGARFRLDTGTAAPVFFSQLRRTLEAKMPNRMTVMALRGLISNPNSGIKAEELEWTGLKDFLDAKNPGDFVTKAEALAATKDVELVEVLKGEAEVPLDQLKAMGDEELRGFLVSSLGYDEETVEDLNREQMMDLAQKAYADFGASDGSAVKFSEWQLRGGKNYRELLLTLPASAPLYEVFADGEWHGFDSLDSANTYKNQHLSDPNLRIRKTEASKNDFRSSHFNEPNILVHVRFNERKASDGKRVLFIEEIQSDWHQKGREGGYAKAQVTTLPADYTVAEVPFADKTVWRVTNPQGTIVGHQSPIKEQAIDSALADLNGLNNGDFGSKVPNAPFKDTSKGWARLAFKRMLRWAAEHGFDRVAWTTGEQQAERYDLSKQVKHIAARKNSSEGYFLRIEGVSGDVIYTNHHISSIPINEVASIVGKELADKISKIEPREVKTFTGPDLKVGGEGMRTFYDQILPGIANDLGKKFGARTEDTEINTGRLRAPEDDIDTIRFPGGEKLSVHSLPVPEAMRASVMQGQARFRLGDPVRVGELRTQSQLENASPVHFPILNHLRGGGKLVIPHRFRGGEYDWYREMGGRTAFFMSEWDAFFKRPDTPDGGGNIDTLAKELRFDNSEDFANAFLAEWQRSRELYQAQKDAMKLRRSMLAAATELFPHKSAQDIGMVMGRAVERVADTLEGDDKLAIEKINDTEGEEAVRNRILMLHQERLFLAMGELFSYDGRNDERPDEIQDEGTLAIATAINEKGGTRDVFDQTMESLDVKRARLYAQALQGVPTITDEAAAAHVRESLDAGGKGFLRDIAQKLTAERLTGATTRPLDKLQTAIMLWYQTDLDERTKDSDRQAQAAVEGHDLNNLKAVDMMRDNLIRDTIDYLNAARQYGSLAGQALQALKLRVDQAFNIVKIYRQARENIGRDLTRAEFEKLKARIDILEKKWNDYVDAATLPDGEAELDARVVELEKKLADVTAARAAVKTEADGLETKKATLEAEYAKQSGTLTELSEKKAQLEAQIATLENEIAMREALYQEVGELQAKVDALQAKLDALDAEYAGASPELLASLEKQLADLTKLHAEKLAAYHKADEELKTVNERLKRVRKLIEKLGKGTKAKIARRRAVIENAANLYREFKAEMERAQVEQLKARWRSAPLPKKALITFEGEENIIQGLQSMADESVVGRQLIKLFRSHPIMWWRAFAQSQHIVFHKSGMTDETGRTLTWQERSDRYYYELDQAQREDPLFDILVRKGGLDWMDITADPTSFDEQQIPIGPLLNNMLPSKATRFVTSVLGVSNNHYAGMSNMLRFAVAKHLYNQMSVSKGETPNEDDIYAIVSTVDIFGGRGDMSTQTARAVIDFGRHILYSPRLALANAQYYRRMFGMLANPRYSRQARKMILMEYVRSGIMYATLSVIARLLSWLLYDDKDQQRFQFKSGHTAYTQFMFGQQRVDITGGQATWDRAAMNFLGGGLIDLLPEWAQSVVSVIDNGDKLATETGLVITEQYKRERGDYDTLGRFARSKLKPLTGMFLDMARGKNYEEQAAGPRAQPHQPGYDRRYLNLLRSIAPVPLSLQTAGDLYMGDPDQGIEPVHNPFLFVNWMTMESLGMLARSLPINAELAQQVAEGYTKNAEELESLKRRQRDIMNDREMSPEMKELKAGRIQDKLDRLRGL